jgi:hypothetical protein
VARIRTIKPEFWTDERVGECSANARLLFIASWNFADDQGGLERSAKQLKAQAFPYDTLDCEPLVKELINAGLLIEYQVGGKTYLHINGFRKHQRVEKPAKPRVPVYDDSLNTPRVLPESSPTSYGLLSKGREGKGKDKDPTAASLPAEPPEFAKFKLLYPKRSGDQPWKRALRAINARLKEGHGWEEILDGTLRYVSWCKSTGKLGTEHVMQAARFCGPEKPFLGTWELPTTKADTRLASNLDAAAEFLRRTG